MRVLFVNSGILGHRSVARLLRQAAAADPEIRASHLDLSEGLTAGERVVRRALCLRAPGLSRSNLDLARWRHELHAGLLAARRIRARERGEGPFDILHFHTQPTAYASLRRMRRTPSVVSIDITQRLASLEAPPGVERATYGLNVAHDRLVFRAARAITATSRWAADDLVRGQPECEGRVHVMPYPVPLEGFGEGWAEERRARAAAAEPPPARVLFVGGDFPRKGGHDLLAAWREGGLSAVASLTLATDWPLREEELPPGVSVVRGVAPYTPQWYALWRGADLFAMPTRGEAFGMVFQEAAAAAIPAVGTRINAVPEIVEDGETGVLVPPGDAGALVEALRGLIASPEARQRMGEAARRRIAAVASPERYAARLAALLRSVAEGGRGG